MPSAGRTATTGVVLRLVGLDALADDVQPRRERMRRVLANQIEQVVQNGLQARERFRSRGHGQQRCPVVQFIEQRGRRSASLRW